LANLKLKKIFYYNTFKKNFSKIINFKIINNTHTFLNFKKTNFIFNKKILQNFIFLKNFILKLIILFDKNLIFFEKLHLIPYDNLSFFSFLKNFIFYKNFSKLFFINFIFHSNF
jgi:hypothetical protein